MFYQPKVVCVSFQDSVNQTLNNSRYLCNDWIDISKIWKKYDKKHQGWR